MGAAVAAEVRYQGGGAGRGHRVDRGLQPRAQALGPGNAQPGGLRARPGGKGRRVSAPGKGGGFAAAGLLAPAKGTGPPLRPQGCSASRWRATALRAALDPGDHCGPWDQEKPGRPGLPPPGHGRKKASHASHDHHNRSLHGLRGTPRFPAWRSEEHTSELQSRENLVCRLLLEKKTKSVLAAALYSLKTATSGLIK